MSLIGYYCLESHSWKRVDDLEQKITTHFLSDETNNAYVVHSAEKLGDAFAGDGNQELISELMYNTENFRILYCNSKKRSSWKLIKLTDWFMEIVPKKIETELVFEAEPIYHVKLELYLREQRLKIKGVPLYSPEVTYVFVTSKHEDDMPVNNYIGVMRGIVERKFPQLDLSIGRVNSESKKEYLCSGWISGDCGTVFNARESLLMGVNGVQIKKENVQFRRKR